MKRYWALGLALVFLCSGCATYKRSVRSIKQTINSIFESDEDYSAQELAYLGMDAFEDGDYKEAIEHFQQLKDFYPFSKYAILAELKLGDAHYHRKEYEDAIFAYEEFEKLHPSNEAIPYVIYQIGRCHFDRISTIDRDQTPAREALKSFQRLQKQFPEDPYARRAEEHILECQRNLAGHEFVVGRFYFKSKHYEAALSRFMAVLSDYPDLGYHQKALDYVARCERKLAGN
jgi:outer membrane protein assembly factor BamD